MSTFLLQFDTCVVSCVPAELTLENNGKKDKLKGFNLKLKDTILFPEGGGQVSFPSNAMPCRQLDTIFDFTIPECIVHCMSMI